MQNYRHILVALDFTGDSALIGARAIDLARHYQATLSLVHVVEHIPIDPANELLMTREIDLEQQMIGNARNRLGELATQLGVGDVPQYVELGATKHEIIRIAKENAVDLIVLGSHGRHGLGLLLGSTANAVLHGAPCDVLAVRVKS